MESQASKENKTKTLKCLMLARDARTNGCQRTSTKSTHNSKFTGNKLYFPSNDVLIASVGTSEQVSQRRARASERTRLLKVNVLSFVENVVKCHVSEAITRLHKLLLRGVCVWICVSRLPPIGLGVCFNTQTGKVNNEDEWQPKNQNTYPHEMELFLANIIILPSRHKSHERAPEPWQRRGATHTSQTETTAVPFPNPNAICAASGSFVRCT